MGDGPPREEGERRPHRNVAWWFISPFSPVDADSVVAPPRVLVVWRSAGVLDHDHSCPHTVGVASEVISLPRSMNSSGGKVSGRSAPPWESSMCGRDRPTVWCLRLGWAPVACCCWPLCASWGPLGAPPLLSWVGCGFRLCLAVACGCGCEGPTVPRGRVCRLRAAPNWCPPLRLWLPVLAVACCLAWVSFAVPLQAPWPILLHRPPHRGRPCMRLVSMSGRRACPPPLRECCLDCGLEPLSPHSLVAPTFMVGLVWSPPLPSPH